VYIFPLYTVIDSFDLSLPRNFFFVSVQFFLVGGYCCPEAMEKITQIIHAAKKDHTFISHEQWNLGSGQKSMWFHRAS
jgi:hypothetical protein